MKKNKTVGTFKECFLVSCQECKKERKFYLEQVDSLDKKMTFTCEQCKCQKYNIDVAKEFECPSCQEFNLCIIEPKKVKRTKDKKNISIDMNSSVICSNCFCEFETQVIVENSLPPSQWKRILKNFTC